MNGPKEILIVEDSPTQAEQLRFLLESAGYQVRLAENGMVALELLEARIPHLMISDIVMPLMNGCELCKKIREDVRFENLTTILLTSLSDPQDLFDVLVCDADLLITKPYNENYLLGVLTDIFASPKPRQRGGLDLEIEVKSNYGTRRIKADPQRMFTLLLSTYEAAAANNVELLQAKDELSSFNEQLEARILERTDVLEKILREKEALFKEVHHRVKNNLQVINSLLRLEVGRSKDRATKDVLQDMKGRIMSMAILHETIYRSGILAEVDMAAYLRQVGTQALRSSEGLRGGIKLNLELDPVRLEIDQAIPCGLILNELTSNCFKHAFPDGKQGELSIRLKVLPETGALHLSVADDGIGVPPDLFTRHRDSLGLQLVQDLVRQLDGKLRHVPGAGAHFEITFKPKMHDGVRSPISSNTGSVSAPLNSTSTSPDAN